MGSFLEKVAGKGLRHGGLRRVPGRCVGGRPGWSPPPTPGRGLAVPSREGQRPQGQRSEAQESACLLQACLTSPSPDPVALKQDPGNGKPAACMSRVSRAGIPPRGAFPEDILGPVPGLGHPRGHFRLRVLPIPLRRTSLWWAQGFLWLGGGHAARVHELRLSGGLAFPRRCSELTPQTPVGTCSRGWPAGGPPT